MHHHRIIQIITFISLLASVFLITVFARNIIFAEQVIRSFGIIAPLVSIGLVGLLSFTPITSDSILVINGALYGPITGTLIGWMGNNLAALVEYFLGKSIGTISDFEKNKDRLPLGLGKIPADSVWFLLLGRLIPGYGGKIVSLLGGIYKVPLWRYIWTAAVTNLIGALLLSLLGSGIVNGFGH